MAPVSSPDTKIIDPCISEETYHKLYYRAAEFKSRVNDGNTVPVTVFDPLSPAHVEQIMMIRNLSKELQAKKDEDIRKAAQKAAEALEKPEEVPKEEEEKTESSENTEVVENKETK